MLDQFRLAEKEPVLKVAGIARNVIQAGNRAQVTGSAQVERGQVSLFCK